jgi:hypothetical protein
MRQHTPVCTVGDLIHCWAGECLMSVTPTFATWTPGFPMIHSAGLAEKQIAADTAQEVLRHEGYRPVADTAQMAVIKFLGGGTVIWADDDDGLTLWAPAETYRFVEQYPIILGFPAPPGGIAPLAEDLVPTLPPTDYGTLAMLIGGRVMPLDELTTDDRLAQAVLAGLVAHLDLARRQKQDLIETELWAVFQSYHFQLITRYAHIGLPHVVAPVEASRRRVRAHQRLRIHREHR